MDSHLHQDLLKIWHQRSKNTTLDEQHCVERILGRDNVRSSDLIKLSGILHKISDPKTVCEFFAMDGYQGDDPKKYVELFRYDAEEIFVANTSEPYVCCIVMRWSIPPRVSILFRKHFRWNMHQHRVQRHVRGARTRTVDRHGGMASADEKKATR
ncbi:uncharacterized protein TNCV_858811 [Trichonephila clavipes]|nr:uncharacterized protein TNCV_858811 [Trichonephila clavipes]